MTWAIADPAIGCASHSIDAHARAPHSQRGAAAAHLSFVARGRQFGRPRCLGCQKCQGRWPMGHRRSRRSAAHHTRLTRTHARNAVQRALGRGAPTLGGPRSPIWSYKVPIHAWFGWPGASKLARARPSTVAHRRLGRAQARFRWVPGGRGEFCRLGESGTTLGEAGARGVPAGSGDLDNFRKLSTHEHRIPDIGAQTEGRGTEHRFFRCVQGWHDGHLVKPRGVP